MKKPAKLRARKPRISKRARPEVKIEPVEAGQTGVLELLCPPSADLTHAHFLLVDGVYHAYLYITGYGYQTLVTGGWLSAVCDACDGVSVSFTLRRQQKEKILPKIAQSTMWSRSRMREVGDTRADYEDLEGAISAGLWLKDALNRCNEELYYMYTLIEVTGNTADELEQRIADVQTQCVAQDIVCKRCDYAQAQAYQSFLPVCALDPDLERKARRNVTTTGAAAAFPFSSFEICDPEGIVLGINQHTGSLCMLDNFDSSKYSSGNMAVVGMTGAGKTYLLQLIAMQYREQQVQVFIVAPLKGHEFRPACQAIGGCFIKLSPSSQDCINILEIRRDTHEVGLRGADSLLADRIAKVHIFFSLLKPDMTDEQRVLLDVALVECYARFGITYDNASLCAPDGSRKPMPILADLYGVLQEQPEARPLAIALTRFVSGSASRLGQATNVSLDNRYTVFDISELGKDLLPLGMFLVTDFCWDFCKRSRTEKKVLILDELWNLMGSGSNTHAAEFVLEIFKIIRGYGGIAVGATQDLNDFFALENGKYGTAVVNNSRIKLALMTEENEARRVQDMLGLTDEELDFYRGFDRGQALLCAGKNRIGVNIHASRLEHALITTDRRDLERQASLQSGQPSGRNPDA